MTHLEIRLTMNETVEAWRRSRGDTWKKLCTIIVRAMETHPWLHDQVPYEVAHTAILVHTNGKVRLPQAWGDWCLR